MSLFSLHSSLHSYTSFSSLEVTTTFVYSASETSFYLRNFSAKIGASSSLAFSTVTYLTSENDPMKSLIVANYQSKTSCGTLESIIPYFIFYIIFLENYLQSVAAFPLSVEVRSLLLKLLVNLNHFVLCLVHQCLSLSLQLINLIRRYDWEKRRQRWQTVQQ